MVIQTWYTSGFRLTNTTRMVTDNVTLHGAGSMGFGEFGGEGGNVYRDCHNVRRPGSPHLLSSNHDGFHSYAMATGPTLERVEIGFCGDDALNIHSTMSLMLKPVPGAADTLFIIDAGLPDALSFNARRGDTVQFYDVQTVSAKGEATVQSVVQVTDAMVLAEAKRTMSGVNAQCSGGCGIFNCSGICGFHYDVHAVFEVSFGPALPALAPFDIVQVKGRSADGAVIRDCHFHDAYDGVMQLRSPGAVIEGNLFERAHTMGVATAKSWLEGAAALHGIRILNNRFVDCCTPKAIEAGACDPISVTACTNCTKENNTFVPGGSTKTVPT
eukprot:SAG22_NODE_2160_length_2915_cov_4.330256_3_plen_328_part_00